ncbi:MAG TPA: CopD family protein, partial [Wenzhouxiangellaceae bacterium]|nr:CopD family protein [Wenzhouxiangellaceae bacterium]
LAVILTAPGYYLGLGWLHAKLVLVALLIGYHLWCWRIVLMFREGRNHRNHVWYRWFNEAPALLLVAIVLLAVLKPF